MATIVRRTRALLSAITDDYFDDLDLVNYINDAKHTLISTAIKLELDQPKKLGRSIRALNNLRTEKQYSTLTFASFRDFYSVDISVDDIDNPDNLLYIGASNDNTVIYLTELLQNRRFEMDIGLVEPTAFQGYWFFFNDPTPDPDEKNIRIYFQDNEGTTVVNLMYIQKFTFLDASSAGLIDLPDRLIKAVALRAAIDAANSETRANVKNYLELYSNELETHLW